MKLVFAGAWGYPWYEEACSEALRRLGHDVVPFSWKGRVGRISERLMVGPQLSRLNNQLHALCEQVRPDILFVYRATHIFKDTLLRIKESCPGIRLAQYCNDDPFSPHAARLLWRHLIRALPAYDVHFVYRESNIGEIKERSASSQPALLRSYFVPWLHRPLTPRCDPKYDISFVGHYEDDGRELSLKRLREAGAKIVIRGGATWPRRVSRLLELDSPIKLAYGDDYCATVSNARISLSFLSKLNRDTYTRRNFEIPAMGGFMLAEYSDDLASLFREGVEAEFFRDDAELVEKARFYLTHDDIRFRVAQHGMDAVHKRGHDVISRMSQMIEQLSEVDRASS